jgi:hypothetical protein
MLVCEDKQISVMIANMALQKFAKKINFRATSSGTSGEYCPVFWFLKHTHKSFHHPPKTEHCSWPGRNSEYY